MTLEAYNCKEPMPVTTLPHIEVITLFDNVSLRSTTPQNLSITPEQRALIQTASEIQLAVVNTHKVASVAQAVNFSLLNNNMDMFVNGAGSAPLSVPSGGATSERWYTGANFAQLLAKMYNWTVARIAAPTAPDEGSITVKLILFIR